MDGQPASPSPPPVSITTSAGLGYRSAWLFTWVSVNPNSDPHAWAARALFYRVISPTCLLGIFVLFRQVSGSPGWSQTPYVAKDDLKLFILLLPPLECQDDRYTSPGRTNTSAAHFDKCSQCTRRVLPVHRALPPPSPIAPSSRPSPLRR